MRTTTKNKQQSFSKRKNAQTTCSVGKYDMFILDDRTHDIRNQMSKKKKKGCRLLTQTTKNNKVKHVP